jgi:RNA polymerase sigma-70 factor (ECF subfamily)
VTDTTQSSRFERIAMPHLDAAYNLARWLTGDAHEANDIAQEAMLRALRFFDTFQGEDPRAWLLKIVRNTYYSHWRRGRARGDAVEFEEELHSFPDRDSPLACQSADENPEHVLSRKQQLGRLDAALERLPAEYREIVVLRELEDLSYREIAETLDIPIGTVMSRLSRARKQLAHDLQTPNGEAHELHPRPDALRRVR